MRSPMVTNLPEIPNKEGYGALEVLQSGAGYYIGTLYTNVEPDGTTWQEPGSRDSDYFATREAAERELKTWEIVGDETAAMIAREHP